MARVLDALRAREDWDETVVIVIGDHGEGLCQHGLAAHGSTWNEQLHAPLLMRVPGQAQRRVAVRLSAIDALPTLMGLLEAPQARGLLAQSTGRDVLAADFEPRPILSQDTGRHRSEGVPYRHALGYGRWKLFRVENRSDEFSWELYDLDADPFELADVSAEHPETTRQLGSLLERELSTLAERGRALRSGEEPATRLEDPAILEQLRALGYVVDE
jgi:arylsulfatase A-like enzyme